MTTYKDAGVNIEMGDVASKVAFAHAMATFSKRKNMIGEPVCEQDGFSGLLDFGKFYLAMNSDGVGTKIEIALKMNKFQGLGYDLLAMVADDAICLGAEIVAITNTFDTQKVETRQIDSMMKSLYNACIEQKVVIAGGEIAELGTLCHSTLWNSTSIGILEKDKLINSKNIKRGDIIISLQEKGLRSNGFSLVRKILTDNFGEDGIYEKFQDKSFGSWLLTPSIIYHDAILNLCGRFEKKEKIKIKAIAHITGGGIPGNLRRILKKNNLGARLENIYEPPEFVKKLKELGNVSDLEAMRAWNLGNGMLIVLDKKDVDQAINILEEKDIKAKVVGEITGNPKMFIRNFDNNRRKFLEFEV